ncbi:choline-phosphate cytidylyltransferase [Lachnospiraceae bacterium]|nr:choline-phosphate cytidylyltransferase [Lachnospiraceae bacterium]
MKKVITYGTFDLFHEGHYNLLKHAKELGDYLVVGVTTQHFDEARGKVNVVDPIMTRIENVKKTGFADEIIVEDHDGQKIEDIQKYDVDIFTVGSDWVGHFDYLNAFCKVVYLPRTPGISSTMKRNNSNELVNLGLVGTGRLAPRFYDESKFVSGVEIVAAFNPDTTDGTAEKFTKRFNVPVEHQDYDKFLDSVHAVYIESPNETHYEYAKKALLADKHVLSEKPLTFTREQAEELYKLAEEKGIVLMEGIKTAYCPGFQQLINVAKSGKIGEIRDVTAVFTRIASKDSREMTDEKYGGAFLENGSYPLLPIIKLMGMDFQDIRIDCIDGPNGIDHYTQIMIRYKNGFATAKAGVGVKSEGQLVIAGTEGYIIAQSPWWLTHKFDIRYEDPNKIEHYEPVFQGDGFRYEIAEFVRKINGSSENGYRLTSEESIAMADVVEKFLRQRGRL